MSPIPLIDSSTAIYELLVKKLETNKLSVRNLKYSTNPLDINSSSRRSKQIDVVVLTDVIKKKKKKKELKPAKSKKFPSFLDPEAKPGVALIPPMKETFPQDGRKVVNDVKISKDSKNNEPVLLPARKNVWYLNPSSSCLREIKNIEQGKPTQIKN